MNETNKQTTIEEDTITIPSYSDVRPENEHPQGDVVVMSIRLDNEGYLVEYSVDNTEGIDHYQCMRKSSLGRKLEVMIGLTPFRARFYERLSKNQQWYWVVDNPSDMDSVYKNVSKTRNGGDFDNDK